MHVRENFFTKRTKKRRLKLSKKKMRRLRKG
jgi:hypothetical protein